MKNDTPDKEVFVFAERGSVAGMLGIAQNLGTSISRISVLRLAAVATHFDKNKHCFLTRRSDAELCLSVFGEKFTAIGRSPEVVEIVPRERTIKNIRRSGTPRKTTVILDKIASSLDIEEMTRQGVLRLEND